MLAAAFIVLPFLAQSAFAATCARSYTIQEGDICDSISAAQNVSTYQLAVVNPTIDSGCTNLTPSDTICLGYEGEDCSTTYVVTSGDDCEIVATKAGVNTTILFSNNPQLDSTCSNMYIGEVLCISGSVQVPIAPSGSIPAVTIPSTAVAAVSTSAVASSSVVPVTTTSVAAVPTNSVVPTSTVIVKTTVSPSASATASAVSEADDDDDDSDLPYCDEL